MLKSCEFELRTHVPRRTDTRTCAVRECKRLSSNSNAVISLSRQLDRVTCSYANHGNPLGDTVHHADTEPVWPYCNSARHMISAVKTTNDPANWTGLEWHRHIERLGNVSQSLAKNPKAGALDSTWYQTDMSYAMHHNNDCPQQPLRAHRKRASHNPRSRPSSPPSVCTSARLPPRNDQ